MRFLLGARRARQPPSKFCPSIARHKLLSKRQCEVRRKYGRQRSNQLRGARGASAHVCSTGLSTGRHLMPMTARCGAAALCRGATTVRHCRIRGEWWKEHRTRAAAAVCEGVSSTSSSQASTRSASSSQRITHKLRGYHARISVFCSALLDWSFALLSSRPLQQIWPDYYRNPCICNRWLFQFCSWQRR